MSFKYPVNSSVEPGVEYSLKPVRHIFTELEPTVK